MSQEAGSSHCFVERAESVPSIWYLAFSHPTEIIEVVSITDGSPVTNVM